MDGNTPNGQRHSSVFLREKDPLYTDMSPKGALNLSPVQGSPGGATQLGVCRDNESALPKGGRQTLDLEAEGVGQVLDDVGSD